MEKSLSTNTEANVIFKMFLCALCFLFLQRIVVVAHYVLGSTFFFRVMLRASLRSEFDRESLARDVTISACISVFVFLAVPQAHTFLATVLLASFSWFFRQRRNNPAIGLAWSFYFGYLKKVLPKFAAARNSSQFKDDTLDKVFVLVPADCTIHQSLIDVDPKITFATNLQPHAENVAGIQVRKYIHSSYKIDDPRYKRPFYAAIEYATPLNTLRDMCMNKKAGLSEAERDRQALLFYDKIKYIIENLSEQDDPMIKRSVAFVFLPKGANIVDSIIDAS